MKSYYPRVHVGMSVYMWVQVLKYVSLCVHVCAHVVAEVGVDTRIIHLKRVPKLLTYSPDSISIVGDTHSCSSPYIVVCGTGY